LAVFVWLVTSLLLVFGMPLVDARMGVRPFVSAGVKLTHVLFEI
jgi:hypothetical protein